MPNLGVAEIIAILVVALVVLGPKRLPEVGRKIGGLVRELRSHSESVKAELRDVIDIDGVAESVNSVRRDLKEATNFTSVFTDTTPSLPRSRPTAPPLAGGDAGATSVGSEADETAPAVNTDADHPMMRVLERGALGAGPPASAAAAPGPTRRLPGTAPASSGADADADGDGAHSAHGNGDGSGTNGATRRLPGGGDPA